MCDSDDKARRLADDLRQTRQALNTARELIRELRLELQALKAAPT